MTWDIAKSIELCFGHRVHTQSLNTEFSCDGQCKCRHLHGHQGKLIVHLASNELNEQGMVTDFKHLNWLKKFVDDYLDHKFIMDLNDPMFASLGNVSLLPVKIPNCETVVGYTIDTTELSLNLACIKPEEDVEHVKYLRAQLEVLEGYFVVNFVPTSENFTKWFYEFVSEKMKRINVDVSEIEWWETPKSVSRYSKPYNL